MALVLHGDVRKLLDHGAEQLLRPLSTRWPQAMHEVEDQRSAEKPSIGEPSVCLRHHEGEAGVRERRLIGAVVIRCTSHASARYPSPPATLANRRSQISGACVVCSAFTCP